MRFLLLTLTLMISNAFSMERVYVVDTAIDFSGALKTYKCENGHKSVIPNFKGDETAHGTMMSDVIIKGLSTDDLCIVSVKVFSKNVVSTIKAVVDGLTYLKTQVPGIINMSFQGSIKSIAEEKVLKELLDLGFKLSLTSGNATKKFPKGLDLSKFCRAYPACYFKEKREGVRVSSNHVIGVNRGGPTTHYDNMTGGTSFSTANTTNKWVKEILSGEIK